MNFQYDLSIIVSVLHPNKEYLQAVILSAKRLVDKSHQKVELLLGNDGSPADEWHIFDECAALAPELVKLFHFPLNRGIGRTRTNLIKRSSGRYVMPFDGDDILLPFDLDGEIAFLDENLDYGASYAQKYLFKSSGLTGEIHGAPLSDFQSYFTPKININAMLIRREMLDQCHGFRQIPGSHINEDVYLMLRLIRESKIRFSPEGRCLYRIHDRSVCHLYGGEQDDFRYMAKAMIQLDIDLLRSWLSGKVPAVPPERRHISAAVAGAALFLYQKDQNFAYWILKTATREFPDDYGAWEHLLFYDCQLHAPDVVFPHVDEALAHFPDDASRQLPILMNLNFLLRRGISVPQKWLDLLRDQSQKWFAIPENIKEFVPVKPRATYSFAMPKLKI